MIRSLWIFLLCVSILSCSRHTQILIEAESFDNKGGWVVDQQFMDVMGSPFLMAHGLGTPVEDASTHFTIDQAGEYQLFVRTRNWNAPWNADHPAGIFQLSVDQQLLEPEYGTHAQNWSWTTGTKIRLEAGEHQLTLHDRTGFNARCDAILISGDPDYTPPDNPDELETLREMPGKDTKPALAGSYDLVVVGGGMAGTCTAISAARLGLSVALIQNRPVLGGNNSSEVRVHLGGRINLEPYPNLGNLVNEIGPVRGGNAQAEDFYEDDKKLNAVAAEKNISLFLNYHANAVETKDGLIRAIVAENTESGISYRFEAPLFADCTGDATIGFLAGAHFMIGREGRETFGEPTAPEQPDSLTMGASVQWFASEMEQPSPFPDIAWSLPWNEEKAELISRGDWNWETGMGKNMILDFEAIRDYGLLVVFSNWSYVKNHALEKERFEKQRLEWVAWIAGKRESRRLVGDYILVEQDLVDQRVYPDGTASASWTIDLHYPDPANSQLFPGEEFKSIAKHITIYPYPIPFRCLYSANVGNLMMAGRNISVSHVALGTVRLMRTCGMEGEVLGMAASICKKEGVLPRQIYSHHFDQLQTLMKTGVGNPEHPFTQTYNLGSTKGH